MEGKKFSYKSNHNKFKFTPLEGQVLAISYGSKAALHDLLESPLQLQQHDQFAGLLQCWSLPALSHLDFLEGHSQQQLVVYLKIFLLLWWYPWQIDSGILLCNCTSSYLTWISFHNYIWFSKILCICAIVHFSSFSQKKTSPTSLIQLCSCLRIPQWDHNKGTDI